MNEAHGHCEYCIRFYSSFRAWQLYPDAQKLDVIKQYVATHNINTRKHTPTSQLSRLAGTPQAAS